MSTSTRALLSLWNDVAAERTAEYDLWHTIEHVPERVWVPGFVAGTRYVAMQAGQPRYFTLYELEDLACLASAPYQELVEKPTPWSASMRPSFANFLRKTGPLLATAGQVLGNALTVTRLVWPAGQAPEAAAWPAWAQRLLAANAAGLATRVRIQQVEPAGPQALRNVDAAPAGDEFLVLLEHAAAEASSAAPLAAPPAPGPVAPAWHWQGSYRFASQVRHADVTAPTRPAPRTDLMPR